MSGGDGIGHNSGAHSTGGVNGAMCQESEHIQSATPLQDGLPGRAGC